MSYDVKVVGSGLAGSVIAERLASNGYRVLVLERRDHVGGNCYDELDVHGVRVHRYGPHIFRSESTKVIEYLSQFTEWRPYVHRVLSRSRKGLLPIPINATTLEGWFGVKFASEKEAEQFLAWQQVKTPESNSEEVCLSRVGRELYEEFFAGYTKKQWGRDPSRLAPGVCGRIPVRFDRDDRYFGETFQALPKDGYTAMFDRMLAHPNIDVATGEDAIGEVSRDETVVWTGRLDEAFDFRHGKLPWRSLRFDLASHQSAELIQPAAVINEPSFDVPYTRTTEYRWLTGQEHDWTTLHVEYPLAMGEGAEAYYPVPSPENDVMLGQYRAETTLRPLWTFAGRLARYQYLEMGQAVGQALSVARKLLSQ